MDNNKIKRKSNVSDIARLSTPAVCSSINRFDFSFFLSFLEEEICRCLSFRSAKLFRASIMKYCWLRNSFECKNNHFPGCSYTISERKTFFIWKNVFQMIMISFGCT